MFKNIELSINLYTEGEKFFNVLKAFIRDSKKSEWPHEKERAAYAKELFLRALESYEKGITLAEQRVEQGFHTQQDKEMVRKMRERHTYWTKKYKGLVGEENESCCCQ